MSDFKQETRPRRPLREVVADIDRDILRMLLRRHNLLDKMRNSKGFLEPTEEKLLRQSWEAAAARISHDPRLTVRLFSLLQEVEFIPRPARAEDGDEAAPPAETQRTAFNLAPPLKPVRLELTAPQERRASQAMLMLAAGSGQVLRLAPCLLDDATVDQVKALAQMGAAVTREENGVTVRASRPLGCPDKVLHVGSCAWNFFLLLAFYLGRPSRARFSGEAELKLADLSAVRRFLPQMGARLTHVVPKSDGLPVRIECSGILPDHVTFPAEAPAELAEAILLAAPFYDRAISLELGGHPCHAGICAHILPLLQQVGADVSQNGTCVRVAPAPLLLQEEPDLPIEPELAATLLALPLALGGKTRLGGHWPQDKAAAPALAMLRGLGLALEERGGHITASASAPLGSVSFTPPADCGPHWLPLASALAALVTLRGGKAGLPVSDESRNDETGHHLDGFLLACGLERQEDGSLAKKDQNTAEGGNSGPASIGWNAPSPAWALALALAACGRDARLNPAKSGFKLGNPGIMMQLYPEFWALYNALPEPAEKRPRTEDAPAPARRRIRTRAVAVPPELPEEV